MPTLMTSTGITFPDSSSQSVAAVIPTNISAFTNDAGYLTSSSLSTYGVKASSIYSADSYATNCNCNCFVAAAYAVRLYNGNGTKVYEFPTSNAFNCNCNC
jgi:uncharacterized protein (UPF0333 family)